MPNTAMAVTRPAPGNWNVKPSSISVPGEILRLARHDQGAKQGQHGEQPDFDGGEFFDSVVAAAEQQQQGGSEQAEHPGGDGNHRPDEVQHLRHAAEHRSDLEPGEDDHSGPEPDGPVDTGGPGSGHMFEALGSGFAGEDNIAAHFGLDGRLDDAAQDDDPHGDVANLRAQRGGGDQFAGAHDGRGKDHPGADAAEDAEERPGWFDHLVGLVFVRISGDAGVRRSGGHSSYCISSQGGRGERHYGREERIFSLRRPGVRVFAVRFRPPVNRGVSTMI